ncbi:MAG: hypothetical protein JXR39_04765, partial [Marinilabiliaceae bacterium]|nr:hypothetical protein [Marinilabiliaceae bacterium]
AELSAFIFKRNLLIKPTQRLRASAFILTLCSLKTLYEQQPYDLTHHSSTEKRCHKQRLYKTAVFPCSLKTLRYNQTQGN